MCVMAMTALRTVEGHDPPQNSHSFMGRPQKSYMGISQLDHVHIDGFGQIHINFVTTYHWFWTESLGDASNLSPCHNDPGTLHMPLWRE